MKKIKILVMFSLLGIVCVFSRLAVGQGMGAGADTIVQLTDSVFRRGATSNIFIVTDDGIIVVDGTCDGGGQQWLKEELARRYDVPVRYVILSHDHEMHICGLQAFDDTAVTVAHRNALPHIVRESRNTSIPDITFEESMEIHLGGKRVVLYYFCLLYTSDAADE